MISDPDARFLTFQVKLWFIFAVVEGKCTSDVDGGVLYNIATCRNPACLQRFIHSLSHTGQPAGDFYWFIFAEFLTQPKIAV